MWKDIPVPFFMSVYFFHILNPSEMLSGEKPMVEQRGPYVYRYRLLTRLSVFISDSALTEDGIRGSVLPLQLTGPASPYPVSVYFSFQTASGCWNKITS